jgi:hypothetical protein
MVWADPDLSLGGRCQLNFKNSLLTNSWFVGDETIEPRKPHGA